MWNGEPTDDGIDDLTLSRRDFGKAAGGAMLLAAATDTAVARGLDDQATVQDVADVPPVDEAFTPPDWYTIAPFQYQRRDTEVGWLFPGGGEGSFGDGGEVPQEGDSLPSAFAAGSDAEWRTVSASDGSVGFPQASEEIDPTDGEVMPLSGGSGQFDDFQDWYGIGGVLYGVGYAFTTVEMDATRRAVLETNATVWVNGQKYDQPPAGVVLREGTNYVLAKQTLTLGVSGSVQLEFRPPESPVEVNDLAAFRGTPQNVVVPDLRVGEDDTDLPASVRVTNTTGSEVSEATLTFAPDSDVLVEQTVDVDPPLAPFETRRVNTRVQLPGAVDGEAQPPGDGGKGGKDGAGRSPSERAAAQATETPAVSEVPAVALTHSKLGAHLHETGTGDELAAATGSESVTLDLEPSTITVVARVSVGDATHERDVPIRVRAADEEPRQSTFTSMHDESVQTFAYRRPANHDEASGPWRLILSLHGANVPAINQAGANVSREDTLVVAPAARGPVNYDHEDIGRLDDLEAMAVARERWAVDDTQVYLSGHSMGGHGTWHIGLTHSDRFAAIGPSAAWTDHDTYIITPWARDELHTAPRLRAVKETAFQHTRAMPKTHNAADGNTPAFVLNGAEDTSVVPMMPRSYVRTLANRGLTVDGAVGDRYDDPDPDLVDVAYLEVPGASHWWDKGIGEGNDSVNHPDMWSFLLDAENDPSPDEVTFYTTNLRVEHRKHWVGVLEQETVHAPTRVDARVTASGVEIETENVAKLLLDREYVFEAAGRRPRRATVDGTTVELPDAPQAAVDAANGEARGLEDASGRGPGRGPGGPGRGRDEKGPGQYGPLAEVHYRPYRLVYGTQGSEEETALNRNLANIRSQRLVDRARAPAPVIPDTAVDSDTAEEYNLVLFGRPSSNLVYSQYAHDFPVGVADGEVEVRGETYTGDLGVEFVYPNPERDSDRLVQVSTGTSLRGVQLTRARNWIPTHTATADYHVFDETVRYQKWNASVAAGFFDKNWEVDPELGVLRNVDHVHGRRKPPWRS